MKGVVPAAGRGTRLRPLTDRWPKALLGVAGRPLLAHALEALAPHVSGCVIVVGYRGDQIRERFGSAHEGLPLRYVEQPEARGLADAVRRAAETVEGDVCQLNGDNVLRGNVDEVVATHRERGADATLLVEEVSQARARRGGVLVVDDDGRLEDVVEKPDEPPSRLATTGCYAFSERLAEAVRAVDPSDRGELELADAVAWLLEHGGSVETVRLEGWRVNVNTIDDRDRAAAGLRAERGGGRRERGEPRR